MRRVIFRLLAFVVIFSSLIYSPLAGQKASEKALKDLDKFIMSSMEDWKIPGLGVAIVKDGEVIFSKGFGFRDVEKGLKVGPETIFNIGSNSKSFTATCAGILVDDGKLEWDKPVKDYLPFFELKDPYASLCATPRDLLSHRTGLPRHDTFWDNSPLSRKEIIMHLRYLPPSAGFRQIMQYTNNMIMTAGYLVGHIAGTTWEGFCKERILDPLGMKDTNFSNEDSKKSGDYALPYLLQDGKFVEIPYHDVHQIGPAAAMNSNVIDMANWLKLNLNKGKFNGKQIISEATLNELHTPQVVEGNSIPYYVTYYQTYGIGWRITNYRGHIMLYHGGGIDGFRAEVFLFPQDNIGMVVFVNTRSYMPKLVAYNAFDHLAGLKPMDWTKRFKEAQTSRSAAEEERKSNTKPSHPLKDYAGDYKHPGYGIFTVSQENDQLKAIYNGISYPMAHFHYDIFEFVNDRRNRKVSFFMDTAGNISSLNVVMEPAVDPIVFNKVSK